MPDDLRLALAKSKFKRRVFEEFKRRNLEEEEKHRDKWHRALKTCSERRTALKNLKFPVVIQPDAFISSPRKLREVADLPSLPSTYTVSATGITSPASGTKSIEQEIDLCQLNSEQIARVHDATFTENIMIWAKEQEIVAVVAIRYKDGAEDKLVTNTKRKADEDEDENRLSSLPIREGKKARMVINEHNGIIEGTGEADGSEMDLDM
ncbi:hypothetical protein F4819DRAFT_483210 [Hypoxylon fuscum]|nr:hypothetical protein F4819DRAFT_483210 [Hypoxylon fuscum]